MELLSELDSIVPNQLWIILTFLELLGPLFLFIIQKVKLIYLLMQLKRHQKCWDNCLILTVQSIQQIQDQIIDEFNFFQDWSEKYQYLIDLGKNLPEFNDSNIIDSNLIKGCQSKVWLTSSVDNNLVVFEADSDAIISKGILSLLIRVFSGHTPEEIISANIDFIDKIGLNSQLSQTRANGLLSMIKQIKIYALAYQAKK